MIRRKIDAYLRNYYAHTRSALLVTGARQTGKTFSIREFGKTFKSFIEINFVENPDAVEIFKGAKSAAEILFRISAMTATPLVKGRTLIFFDEVQRCPDIVTAIKFLVDEGSYRYILSGSLLGGGVARPAFRAGGVYGRQGDVSARFRGVYYLCWHRRTGRRRVALGVGASHAGRCVRPPENHGTVPPLSGGGRYACGGEQVYGKQQFAGSHDDTAGYYPAVQARYCPI